MHVNDVGANGDMGRQWDAQTVGIRRDADLRKRGWPLCEVAANSLTQPKSRSHAIDDGLVQLGTGLLGHAERARP